MCDIKKIHCASPAVVYKGCIWSGKNQCTQKVKEKSVQIVVYKRANLLIVTISALYTEFFLRAIRSLETMVKSCGLTLAYQEKTLNHINFLKDSVSSWKAAYDLGLVLFVINQY